MRRERGKESAVDDDDGDDDNENDSSAFFFLLRFVQVFLPDNAFRVISSAQLHVPSTLALARNARMNKYRQKRQHKWDSMLQKKIDVGKKKERSPSAFFSISLFLSTSSPPLPPSNHARRAFCIRTYGFGPRHVSQTMGKSERSHPSASGSLRRRPAIFF